MNDEYEELAKQAKPDDPEEAAKVIEMSRRLTPLFKKNVRFNGCSTKTLI